MITKQQIKRLEEKMDVLSFQIMAAEHKIEKLREDNELTAKERAYAIDKRQQGIHDKCVQIATMKSVLFAIGYTADINQDETGLDHYTIHQI